MGFFSKKDKGYAITPGCYDPTGGDGFVRGDWRQIENALIAGLITDEEYERIAREAPTAKVSEDRPAFIDGKLYMDKGARNLYK